ncbi:hypothetical protein HMPREF0765_4609 [Sphingobacterium spiritivorum ATCC 33300]|uniref:Uncharacterized protein n=1 Tax=Sphingobacterium spiritivorum ATCC 33300 TaxID=525372 RepID=C2G4V3_SPHSI|nr:BfmA/BtgA family mobilization protein [Sphingobacterium spiritivorum]EEI89704.1 hypothetical protein HMPREF0765_4609 [Sphingobacterium spiritivorum ATCC 33300]QQS94764.1 hypothetical protein I6J03_15415 [Sphingobacterium spiritivorum]
MATDIKLEKIALKLGRTKKTTVIQMVEYFYRSKKDPIDLNDELLKKELVNGNNRIISFFKTQEKDFLLPVFSDVGTLLAIAKQHTLYFKEIGIYLKQDVENVKKLAERMMTLERGIAKTQTYLEEKALLKSRFSKILEHYITQRESLGWTTANVKKEELQAYIRQSLENL